MPRAGVALGDGVADGAVLAACGDCAARWVFVRHLEFVPIAAVTVRDQYAPCDVATLEFAAVRHFLRESCDIIHSDSYNLGFSRGVLSTASASRVHLYYYLK